MDANHTPGPWTCDFDEAVGGSIQVYPKGHFLEPWIADVKCEHVGPQSREEIKANAQLIATAPDLLAALRAMVGLSDRMESHNEDDRPAPQEARVIGNTARTAIKRAQGEPT